MKEKILYSKNYEGNLIEIHKNAGRVSLYVNGVERDYQVINILKQIFSVKGELYCKTNNCTIKVILKPPSATIYVDNVQIDYVDVLFVI